MSDSVLFILIMVASVLISSVSQAMLKASALKEYDTKKSEYLNPLVISAYTLFIISTFVTVYALKYVPLSISPIIEALGYVFIAIIGLLIFKEKIHGKKFFGLCLIIIGTLIATM